MSRGLKIMLKECNNQDLDRNEISGKYYLFFQVWKELTEKDFGFISISYNEFT